MGNNTSNTNPKSPETYTTRDGYNVPSDGHSRNWMRQFEMIVSSWIRGESKSPSYEMNDEQRDYVQNNMEDSENNENVPTGHLTRGERGYHLIPLLRNGQLSEGDLIPDNAFLRSYSRSPNATANYIYQTFDDGSPIVIFRTHNNTKHFNATPFNDAYAHEEESFVNQSQLRIDGFKIYDAEDYDSPYDYSADVNWELGATNNLKFYPEEVVFVEVSPVNS